MSNHIFLNVHKMPVRNRYKNMFSFYFLSLSINVIFVIRVFRCRFHSTSVCICVCDDLEILNLKLRRK